MKNLLPTSLVLMFLVSSSQAFFSGPIATPTTGKLIEADYEYEIDTWGANSEIYEFTPRSNKSMTCVVFILDSGGAMGLQCFPKPNI